MILRYINSIFTFTFTFTWCFAVYLASCRRSWKGCHFLAHSLHKGSDDQPYTILYVNGICRPVRPFLDPPMDQRSLVPSIQSGDWFLRTFYSEVTWSYAASSTANTSLNCTLCTVLTNASVLSSVTPALTPDLHLLRSVVDLLHNMRVPDNKLYDKSTNSGMPTTNLNLPRCCTACCTTCCPIDPQQIQVAEFGP